MDIQRELDRHADLFDRIERSPLTLEQRVAAVTMADRNLLIAAAGSGKTSSMVGKVAYAIRSGQCTPDQILVLAFNRKAALELQERLGMDFPVTVRTLHALGLDIVSRVTGYRPCVQSHSDMLLQQVLRQLVRHDVHFAAHWLLFRVFYHVPIRHPHQFASRRCWRSFVAQHGEHRKRQYGFLSLRDELMPTQFEQAVANWLTLHDIDYAYRPVRASWLNRWGRATGCAPRSGFSRPLTGRAGFYLANMKCWVVCLARRGDAGLAESMMAVYLDDFHDATVFTVLRMRLLPKPLQPDPDRMARLLACLGYRLTPGQTDFLDRFISLARLNGIKPETLTKRALNTSDPTRTRLHAPMLGQLLLAYQAALDEADSIDFEGMLHRAADHLDQGRYRHGYTLVMVDEFQDTSRGGLRVLKSLLAQNRQCKFFAVGDDWQSIYRFAGAVPDVLSRFEHYFGPGTVNYLTATFRFDQSVADLASRFIQANPAQLRKRVVARPAGKHAAVVLVRYVSTPHMYAACEMCLNDVANNQESNSGPPVRVYILGRYQHQRPRDLPRWRRRFPQLDIQYLTVHSAKGLEADSVIVLGLQTGRYGFPSRVADEPLMGLVMQDSEPFPDAEERRLFYVAITRCRHRVYLLASLHQPSPFVTELIKDGGQCKGAGSSTAGEGQYVML